jgi:hypothetical protein
MAPVTSPDPRWVLAVDARPGTGAAAGTASADADGVRPGPGLTAAVAGPRRLAPLAVVVVHPGVWDDDRAARAADEVGTALANELGEDAAEWPWPVPLSALEAAAWRALEFGLLPARGRVAVVDPGTGEAGVVDRDQGQLAGVGRPASLGPQTAGGPEQLVALARRALDDAPPGPPFAGVVVGGSRSADGGAALAGVVARVTGRPPLVPGDPTTVALLGAASLGWAAATASGDAPPRPRPATPARDGDSQGSGGGGRVDGVRAATGGSLPPAAAAPAALPGGRRRGAWSRLPRWARWVVPLVVLALVAGVAGLLVNRERTAPSPFVYTCPNGEVVAFSYECDRLAPPPTP